MSQRILIPLLVSGLAAGLLGNTAAAQYAERPYTVGSGEAAVDASGRSVKNPRVRAIHTTDPSLGGGTAHLIQRDPFLAYQLGRNLNFREFRERDGVFSTTVGHLTGINPDGVSAKITANNQTSCLGCHNLPNGNPGGGPNFSKDSGLGRNTPHYFGAGLVEMLGLQVRAAMLEQLDTDDNGWISAAEAAASGGSVVIATAPGQPAIDYGDPRLDGGSTGRPDLNNIFRVWYVDAQGQAVQNANFVDGISTFGYSFAMTVWGWGQGEDRDALNPTNRAFLWDPFDAHGGLEAYDPSTTLDPDLDGVSEPTLAGAEQFPITHKPRDWGVQLSPLGFSRDDPDGDGYLNEISEGDLDLAEWFMLNAPRPAFAGTPAQYQAGVAQLEAMGCVECHVPDWHLYAQDDAYAGDRRLFDYVTHWNAEARRLSGELVPLFDRIGQDYVPRREDFTIKGLFSDLRHHSLGPRAREVDFGGNVNDIWRTPPLWGVGSSAPYFHDGASLTLLDAIRRHGGAAEASRQAFTAASAADQDTLLDFLERLVLYDIESLPADIDGDGQIAPRFQVAGRNTGHERFNAEWLFLDPVRIEGPLGTHAGVPVISQAATNLVEAYALDEPLRVDSDLDGWPDVWDAAPTQPGYKDGVQ